MCWNISIWKNISHNSLPQYSCPHHRKAGMLPACEDEGVTALFIFCCHGPSGKWLLISCGMMSAISDSGSQIRVRPGWLVFVFFLKAPKFGAQKILQHNESFCDIINKPAPCYNSHEIRKAYVPLWSPDWSLFFIDEICCPHHCS